MRYSEYSNIANGITDILSISYDRNSHIVVKDSDYYYSFPTMTVMPNGNWACVTIKGYCHNDEKQTMFQISSDHGLTWTSEVELFPKARPQYTRLGAYLSTVGSRVFLVLEEKVGKGFLYYSDDNCVTWNGAIALTSTNLDITCYSHGNVIADSVGNLLLCAWGFKTGYDYTTTVILKSTDNGLTWSDLVWFDNPTADTITNDGAVNGPGWNSEPAIVLAPNGNLLYFPRGSGLLYTSEDDGATWDEGVSIDRDFGSPYFLKAGSDLYLMGRRRFIMGTQYRACDISNNTLVYIKSEDSGVTWSDEVVIDKYGDVFEGSGGYCTPILYDTDKIAVVFYTNDGFSDVLFYSYLSDNAPYIRIIPNIFADPNFGDQTMTNIKFTYNADGVTEFEVYGKEGGGEYSLIGTSENKVFDYLFTSGLSMTFKCRAKIGGEWSEYTLERSMTILDPRTARLVKNMIDFGEEPTDTRKTNLNNTILALKAADLLDTQFDAIWVCRNKGNKSSKMNLVQDAFNLYSVDNGGILKFVEDLGYSSDGIKSYLRTTITATNTRLSRVIEYPDASPSSCFGFKISGTIPSNGKHFHGYYFAATHPTRTLIGSDKDTHQIALASGLAVVNKRVVGYNNISKNTFSGGYYGQNDSWTCKSMTSATTSARVLEFYLLATWTNGDIPVDFEGADVVLEMAWYGKYLTEAKFLEFQTIMNAYIANL